MNACNLPAGKIDLIEITVKTVGVFADKIDTADVIVAENFLDSLFLSAALDIFAGKSFDFSDRKSVV